MKDIMDYLYGPLNKNWCIYFYFFSIIFFLMSFFLVVTLIFIITTKKFDYTSTSFIVIITSIYMLAYIQMRILYGMCINSSNPAPLKLS